MRLLYDCMSCSPHADQSFKYGKTSVNRLRREAKAKAAAKSAE